MERAELVGGWQRCGAEEPCDELELARWTLQADHFRFFTSNHSRPVAATIKMTTRLHGVDEVAASLCVDAVEVAGAFFGGGWMAGDDF